MGVLYEQRIGLGKDAGQAAVLHHEWGDMPALKCGAQIFGAVAASWQVGCGWRFKQDWQGRSAPRFVPDERQEEQKGGDEG